MKNQSQCTPRTSEGLDEKEITIGCNHSPVGILAEVSKVNKVLISFISKSAIKHHGVQNRLAVNLPTEVAGTVILALQHYPMLCAFLYPLKWPCVLPKAVSAWACPNVHVDSVDSSLLLEMDSFLLKNADRRDFFVLFSLKSLLFFSNYLKIFHFLEYFFKKFYLKNILAYWWTLLFIRHKVFPRSLNWIAWVENVWFVPLTGGKVLWKHWLIIVSLCHH